MIYLDNAATTRVLPAVLDAMLPYLKEEYGNAGAIYGLGRRAAGAVAIARGQVAELIGAEPEQIIFTSGGSEANSLVFQGLRRHLSATGKTKIIVSAVEHDSVLRAAKALCDPLCRNNSKRIKEEFGISYLGVNEECMVSVDALEKLLTDDVGLVSVMYVNNETGAVNPIREIGELCARKNILFHTDCVQAATCLPIDIGEIGCDFLTISSHKLHGAKGIGALFVKDNTILEPIIFGGSVQEFGRRGGTENVAGIVGFGKACEIAQRRLEEHSETVFLCKRQFVTQLFVELRDKCGSCDAFRENAFNDASGILSLRFDGVDGETLSLMLDAEGVCVSAGSACRSRESTPSHVLTAMGLSPDEARNSIRVSFSEFNDLIEVTTAAQITANCVRLLSDGCSPFAV